MTTLIELKEPVLRCAEEQDIFYQRLSEISGLLKIIQQKDVLQLSISNETLQAAAEDLKSICDMWHTSYRVISDS